MTTETLRRAAHSWVDLKFAAEDLNRSRTELRETVGMIVGESVQEWPFECVERYVELGIEELRKQREKEGRE